MKVLKTEKPEEWSLKITCNNCDSELEAEAKDVSHEWVNGDGLDPVGARRGYDSYAVQCPICDDVIDILSDKLPKVVQLASKSQSARRRVPYL